MNLEKNWRIAHIFIILYGMAKVIGYMLTFTTYGTWLQGDIKGWAKKGKVFDSSAVLKEINKVNMEQNKVVFSNRARKVVQAVILEEAKKLNQKVLAIGAKATHVHIVLEVTDNPAETVAARFKTASRKALLSEGYTGKVWARGFDKRYCFNEEELNARVEYVRKHGEKKKGGKAARLLRFARNDRGERIEGRTWIPAFAGMTNERGGKKTNSLSL